MTDSASIPDINGAPVAVAGKLDAAGKFTPWHGSAQIVADAATSAGSVIATGGAAQLLIAANPNRKGLIVQNQSGGRLYIRDVGADGSLQATLDQHSFAIEANTTAAPPRISTRAYTINGAAPNQAYLVEDW